MNLAATTVTVYFVGLVNFYNPTSDPKQMRAFVPLATATTAAYQTHPLTPHQAKLVIEGLSGAAADCSTLEGKWDKPSTAMCTVENISGKDITLAESSPAALSFDATFNQIPGLRHECTTIGLLRSGYWNDSAKYAARLTLSKGSLHACRIGQAWTAYLTFTDPTVPFSITTKTGTTTVTKTVTLNSGAVVQIVNTGSAGPDEKAHFWWYYAIHDTPVACMNLPTPPPDCFPECPPEIASIHHGLISASGVGCSNTQYP